MHDTCPVDASALQSCPVGSGAFGMLFTGLVSTLLQSATDLANEPRSYPPEPQLPLKDEYDIVIIGAGSAGSVMASRLSEIDNWKVLLLEAGGDPLITTEVPALQGSVVRTSQDWQFWTEKQNNSCLGTEKPGRCFWPRGKCVGGSSNLYAMTYLRGNKCDYDGWKRQGLDDWGYDDVLPYFKKSEDLRSDVISSQPDFRKYHSTGGYYTVSQIKANLSVIESMRGAAIETGYEVVPDLSADKFIAFAETPADIRDGERCSNAKAFLSPAGRRSNLRLLRNAYVTKILIDPHTKTAYGVKFQHGGKTMTVKAAKEVVLSAGSVQSPQILMLSGVGPEDHLKTVGISPIVVNNNVGANLQDHFKSPIVTYCIKNEKYQESSSTDYLTYQYLKSRTGPLATLSCNTFAGFLRTNSTPDQYCPQGYPDIEIQMECVNKTDDLGRDNFLRQAAFGDDARRGYNELFDDCDMTVIPLMTLIHPYSMGSIVLNSSDPFDRPKIDPKYLTRDEDIQRILKANEYAKKFGNTEAMKKIGAEVRILNLEACSKYNNMSQEYLECAVRQIGFTIYHPSGTCKMGASNDSTAVVDPRLKVVGVNNLRVVDASVMPRLPSGNINAVVTMLSEKAADYVKQDWKSGSGHRHYTRRGQKREGVTKHVNRVNHA